MSGATQRQPRWSSHTPRLDPTRRLPGETNLEDAAADVFDAPERWLDTPHPMLGGRSPRECIRQQDEQAVWDLLRTIRGVGVT